jgi:transposase, IS5 family
MKQQSLATQGVFEKYGRKSRRELFLEEMEGIVPRSAMGKRGTLAVLTLS